MGQVEICFLVEFASKSYLSTDHCSAKFKISVQCHQNFLTQSNPYTHFYTPMMVRCQMASLIPSSNHWTEVAIWVLDFCFVTPITYHWSKNCHARIPFTCTTWSPSYTSTKDLLFLPFLCFYFGEPLSCYQSVWHWWRKRVIQSLQIAIAEYDSPLLFWPFSS